VFMYVLCLCHLVLSSGSIVFTAALLPELQLAPKLINPGVSDLSSHNNNNQTHLN